MTDELQGLSAFLRAQAYGLQCDVVIPTSTAPNYNPHTLQITCLVQWATAVDELQAARATPAHQDERGNVWGASTYADLSFALDAAHELSGSPHERITELIRQRDEAQAAVRATPADHSVPVKIYQIQYVGSSNWLDRTREQYIADLNSSRADDLNFRIVYAQPPQNSADHIVDANKKVDADSVPVAGKDKWVAKVHVTPQRLFNGTE